MVKILIPINSNFFATICANLINKRIDGEIGPDFNFQISGALELTKAVDVYGQDLPNGEYSSKIRGHLENGSVIFTERTVYFFGIEYQLRDATALTDFTVMLY